MRAVFIRLDKIGDLICTIPVDQVSFLQDWEVLWVVSKGMGFIPENAEPRRRYIELDIKKPFESLRLLEQTLREFKPDVAASFQAPWWANFALWKCGIPKRLGVLSKWHSFLFLNRGVRQKRSKALKHEADYNLDVLRKLAPNQITEASAPVLQLRARPQPELLQHYDLQEKSYWVVHPGMAGSALNWPTSHYLDLIEKISQQYPVVLTGTPADEKWLTEIKQQTRDNPRVLCLQNQLNTTQLFAVLASARAVFAPSTGVIHMAASLGTPVYGFYSPIPVQRALRWGARGPQVHLYTPDVLCPTKRKCWGEICHHYPCMKKIKPEQIIRELR